MRLKMNFLVIAILAVGFMSGCGSSPKKADIGSSLGPDEIVRELDSLEEKTEEKRGDLLFYKDYKKALGYHEKVRDEAQDSDVDLNDVRKNAAYSKYIYKKIISKSKKMNSKIEPILSARDLALKAGVKKYEEQAKALDEVDGDLRRKTKEFKKELNPEKFGEFQKSYLTLEAAGLIKKKLSKSSALIEASKDMGAKSKAKLSYDTALKSLAVAENMISSSAGDPDRYNESVATARKDAIFLAEVMDVIESSDKDLPEDYARKLVKANFKVEKQEKKIAELEGHADRKKKKAEEKVEAEVKKKKEESEKKKDKKAQKEKDKKDKMAEKVSKDKAEKKSKKNKDSDDSKIEVEVKDADDSKNS